MGQVHFLNAYHCSLSICTLSQNAEWVQIAVMKLFHYGDEQCWINRNNKAECSIEPSVEVLWQRVQLCLQHWWLARWQRWLLAKWNNSYLQLSMMEQQESKKDSTTQVINIQLKHCWCLFFYCNFKPDSWRNNITMHFLLLVILENLLQQIHYLRKNIHMTQMINCTDDHKKIKVKKGEKNRSTNYFPAGVLW